MGIRRRRRRLSTLMSRLDQRVRAVELRPISLLTSSEIEAAVELGQPATGPSSAVGSSAPWQFYKIHDAYLYPKALTGTEDRVEIYLETDLGVAKGDRLQISGIHGGSSFDLDVDGDNFEVKFLDTPPWDDRKVGTLTKHSPEDDQLAGVTITNTYSIKPDTIGPQQKSEIRLQTRRKVDTFSIVDNTVTLTMNADHKFKNGDVIFVDIFSEDSRAYGADGLFYVGAVTNNTIEYTLSAGVDEPTGTITPTADVYVFPTVREWAQVGSTWVDNANNETYYWDGIRWVSYTPGAIAGDGDPPSAPTNLSATSNLRFPDGGLTGVVEVTLSWTPPTTNESGSELTDLASYIIRYREGTTGNYTTWPTVDAPTATSFTLGTLGTFKKETLYSFQLIAQDSGGEQSAAATTTVTTVAKADTNLEDVRPADLTADPPYLGTVTLYWQGTVEDSLGTTQDNPDGLYYVEIHRGASALFTASESTLIGTVVAAPGAKFVDADIAQSYGSTFYYRAVLVDGNGTKSAQSSPALAVTTQSNVDVSAIQGIIQAANIVPGTIVTGEDIIGINITGDLIRGNTINANLIEANSITSDQIDVGNLTAQVISSSLFTSRDNGTGAGITFDDVGLTAFNSSNQPTFFLNAANGYVSIASGMSIGDVTAAYNTANSAYSTANSASSTASTAITTANTANTTANSKLGPGQAAADVNAYRQFTTIDGGAITTGTIDANQIVSDFVISGLFSTGPQGTPRIEIRGENQAFPGIVSFDGAGGTAFRFYTDGRNYLDNVEVAGTLNVSGNITGGTIRTSSSYPRIELSQSTSSLRMRYSSSSEARLQNASWGAFINGDFSVTGIATGNSYSYNIRGDAFTGTFTRGSIYSTSDERLKTGISNSSVGLDFINKLEPVEFKWINDSKEAKNIGVIAQNVKALVEEDYPEFSGYFVGTDGAEKLPNGEDAYGVRYERFIPVLLNAVKELSAQVEQLKQEVEYLKTNEDR